MFARVLDPLHSAHSIFCNAKKLPLLKFCRVSALVILRTFLEEIWTVARIQMWPISDPWEVAGRPLNGPGRLKCKPEPSPAQTCLKVGDKTKKIKAGTYSHFS